MTNTFNFPRRFKILAVLILLLATGICMSRPPIFAMSDRKKCTCEGTQPYGGSKTWCDCGGGCSMIHTED